MLSLFNTLETVENKLSSYLETKGLTVDKVKLPLELTLKENGRKADAGKLSVKVYVQDISILDNTFLYHLKDSGEWDISQRSA